VQQPLDLINLKREHVRRLANQKGAAGEAEVLANNVHYVARPIDKLASFCSVVITEAASSFNCRCTQRAEAFRLSGRIVG
jgi:hypothetical protein